MAKVQNLGTAIGRPASSCPSVDVISTRQCLTSPHLPSNEVKSPETIGTSWYDGKAQCITTRAVQEQLETDVARRSRRTLQHRRTVDDVWITFQSLGVSFLPGCKESFLKSLCNMRFVTWDGNNAVLANRKEKERTKPVRKERHDIMAPSPRPQIVGAVYLWRPWY